LLVIDHLLDRGAAAPAPLPGPGDAGVAGVGLPGLPLLGAPAELGALVAGAVEGSGAGLATAGVLLQKGADAGAELGLLGGVVEIHVGLLTMGRWPFPVGRSGDPSTVWCCRAPAREAWRGGSRDDSQTPR